MTGTPMAAAPIRPPGPEHLQDYATALHLDLPAGRLGDECEAVGRLLDVFDRIDRASPPPAPLRHRDRDPGRSPRLDEDPYHAIVRACHVPGSGAGPLAGWRVGIKDSIAVAGVPTTAGGRHRRAWLPAEDAVVVERVLDAGAAIVATTAVAGAGHAETRNPLDVTYSAGVSSSGSAAAVAGGLVDAALGVDGAGSIRWPAAWCGLVGMKPTHGLVPTYGLAYSNHTLDHIGPITKTVAENATLLDVLAGPDGRDPRGPQPSPATESCVGSLGRGARGLRIGVIAEALAPSGCTPDTLRCFEQTRRTFEDLGAELVAVSVPLWTTSFAIWLAGAVFTELALAEAGGEGYEHLGRVDLGRLAATAVENPLSSPWRRTMQLVREHLRREHLGVHFARAQNLRQALRQQVDDLFADVDLLVTPTSPVGPSRLPTPLFDLAELAVARPPDTSRTFGFAAPILTCCAFDLTGHPALTVPSGLGDDGLPRGLQIVGPRYGEPLVYRAGHAFETAWAGGAW